MVLARCQSLIISDIRPLALKFPMAMERPVGPELLRLSETFGYSVLITISLKRSLEGWRALLDRDDKKSKGKNGRNEEGEKGCPPPFRAWMAAFDF